MDSFRGGVATHVTAGWHPSPFSFACPYCHVRADAYCRTRRGSIRQLVHADRMNLANTWVPGAGQ